MICNEVLPTTIIDWASITGAILLGTGKSLFVHYRSQQTLTETHLTGLILSWAHEFYVNTNKMQVRRTYNHSKQTQCTTCRDITNFDYPSIHYQRLSNILIDVKRSEYFENLGSCIEGRLNLLSKSQWNPLDLNEHKASNFGPLLLKFPEQSRMPDMQAICRRGSMTG